MHYPPGESEVDRVRCSCSTLPNPEETTANHRRSGSSTRGKKLRCRHQQFTNEPHTNARACSLYMTAWESDGGTGK
ncbi:hypothetical protein HispidOSU_001694, partial [Sigmodon hispidus]